MAALRSRSASPSSSASKPSTAGQARFGAAQRRPGAVAVLGRAVERRQRPGRGGAQDVGVAQALALGGELGLLGRIRSRRLDLGELEAHQVEVALARALALAQLLELALERRDLGVRAAVAVAQLEQARTGEPVEDLELGRRQGEPAVLVLAVEGEQPRAERPQVGGRGRAARR